jgi:hypothetical protein
MPGRPYSALEKIRVRASEIRHAHPKKYGVTGRKKGEPGYVKDGFKKAIKVAAKELYPSRHRGKK